MDRPIDPRLRFTAGMHVCAARGDHVGATEYALRLAGHLRELAVRNEIPKVLLADALIELAWPQELSDQFPEALKSAEEAQSLCPSNELSVLRLKYAHALLFARQFDKAAFIYRAHRGQELAHGRKWDDGFLNDFTALREAGHAHPDMRKIEALLKP